VYSMEEMTAFRLGGIVPERWTQFCVSNNMVFWWNGVRKQWCRCKGKIKEIQGVAFPEGLVCKERDG
jgi:hypothetical protein